MTEQKKVERETLMSDATGAFHDLVIEKHPGRFDVFVEPEEVDHEVVHEDEEADEDGAKAIAALFKFMNPPSGDALLVVPTTRGWNVSTLSQDDRKPPRVEIWESGHPEEYAEVDRLFRVLGGEDLYEPTREDRPIDADHEDRALVFPVGDRDRAVYPSDLLTALREIEDEIDSKPGDPGRTVHLVERVRCVLAEAERRGGRGR